MIFEWCLYNLPLFAYIVCWITKKHDMTTAGGNYLYCRRCGKLEVIKCLEELL